MKPRTLILLGGSQQQVVAIESAKACGYRTVLCDYLPDNPGQYYADRFYQVSTTDREAVLDVARAENADGIIAYASDPASSTAAFVAEKLDLPTNPLHAIELLSEKQQFRSYLCQCGLPCPRTYSFSLDEAKDKAWKHVEDFDFPLIVKPTDSSGSKGVSVIHTQQEFAQAVERASKFSRNRILICEEFIKRTFPYIIGGDVFVRNGQIEFWGLMGCLRDEQQSLVPVGKKSPLNLSKDQYERIKNILQRLVSSLELEFGELNVEILIGENGTPYLLELGGRAGGNMIPIQLSDLSGLDLIRANVMCAMGDDPGSLIWDSALSNDHACMTYVIHSLRDGVFKKLTLSREAEKHCYRHVAYVEQGDFVYAFDGADKALGLMFFEFESSVQQDQFIGEIIQHVKVELAEING